MKRFVGPFWVAVLLAALFTSPVLAQPGESWRYLQDARTLDELIAEHEAAKARKIYVDDENQEASKALAAGFKWSVAFAGWTPDAGLRVRAGSGEIVWNNEVFGAGIITAHHVFIHPETGQPYTKMAILLSNDLFTSIADEDNLIYIDMSKMIRHPSLDLAVIPIDQVLVDELGEPIAPIEFYKGTLQEGDVTLIGGYGITGPIEIAGSGNVPGSVWDGFRRAGRAKFSFFSATPGGNAVVTYSSSVPLPGLSGNGDSGGFATIEEGGIGGTPQLWGIIVTGTGVGVNKLIGIEYLNASDQAWVDQIRLDNPLDPDADTDGDGIPDYVEGVGNTDGDEFPDYLDLDSDDDGIPDLEEWFGDSPLSDVNGDDTPNFRDLNSDGDAYSDENEVANGTNPYVPDAPGDPENPRHAADMNRDGGIDLGELLRVVQLYNSGGHHCPVGTPTEDGVVPGADPTRVRCGAHDSDYNPQDWILSLPELLRAIQFFNSRAYHPCETGEDGFCAGSGE